MLARDSERTEIMPAASGSNSKRIPSEEFRTVLQKALQVVPAEQLSALIDCAMITPGRLRDWADGAKAPHDDLRQMVMRVARPFSETREHH